MPEKSIVSKLFNELKPLCVEVSKYAFLPNNIFNPSSIELANALKQLNNKLLSYDNITLPQQLSDYIFVPLSSLLKHDSLGVSQTEYVIGIITQMLRLSWNEHGSFDKKLATQIFSLLTYLISSDKENKGLSEKSTEFKLAGAQALKQFFASLSNQAYSNEFFEKQMLPSFGHSITILLDIAKNSPQAVQLQLECLVALEILYGKIIKNGELLSFVLPGNVSTFSKILNTKGLNVNYKVVIECLSVLRLLLSIVYNDFDLNIEENHLKDIKDLITSDFDVDNFSSDNNNNLSISIKNAQDIKGIHRTTSWLHATSSQIKRSLDSFIPSLLNRRNDKIDDALVIFVSKLIETSWKSLYNCREIFLKTLIDTKKDPFNKLIMNMTEVDKVLDTKIEALGKIIQFDNGKAISSISYALKLYNKTHGKEETFGVSNINKKLFNIILDNIDPGNNANSFKINKTLDTKIIEQSSEIIIRKDFFDSSELLKVQDMSLLLHLPKNIENELSNLIQTIAYKNNILINNIDDFLINILSEEDGSSLTRKSLTIWMSVQLIKGIKYNDNTSQLNNLDDFLEIPDSDDKMSVDSHIYDASINILQYCLQILDNISPISITHEEEKATCVVLYAIQEISLMIGEEFQNELIDFLFVVIESLASSSSLVHSFAKLCTVSLANTLYHGSVTDLLKDNSDYLIDGISQRFAMGFSNKVSVILTVICQIVGYQVIDTFKDVLEMVFKTIDYYHGYGDLCLQFIGLFDVIVDKIKFEFLTQNEKQQKIATPKTFGGWGITTLEEVIDLLDKDITEEELDEKAQNDPVDFEEYIRLKEIDSDDEDDFNEEEEMPKKTDETPPSSEEPWLSPIPQNTYKVLLQFLAYSDRLLTHPHRQLRVKVLQLIKKIIPLLATQRSSLLPQVAMMWNSIASGILSDDYYIVQVSCECIQEIITGSGNFISKRFIGLWTTINKDACILREIRTMATVHRNSTDVVKGKVLPPVIRRSLIAMSGMILEGIDIVGLLVNETTISDMLTICVAVLPSEKLLARNLIIGDILKVKQERVG